MKDQIAKKLLGQLLGQAGIQENVFYSVVEALYRYPFVDRESIALTYDREGFLLRARYTGSEDIGNALQEGNRKFKPGVQENVQRVYAGISDGSGFDFSTVYPGLRENECQGVVRMPSDKGDVCRKLLVALFDD